jgi:hypothetical protein
VLPAPYEAQVSWEQLLRPYLPGAEVFRCPADDEVFPSIGSSYDWRDTGRDDTTLAGHAITDTSRTEAALAYEALPGWHHKGRINVVFLNGSAVSMVEEAYLEEVQSPLRRGSKGPP